MNHAVRTILSASLLAMFAHQAQAASTDGHLVTSSMTISNLSYQIVDPHPTDLYKAKVTFSPVTSSTVTGGVRIFQTDFTPQTSNLDAPPTTNLYGGSAGPFSTTVGTYSGGPADINSQISFNGSQQVSVTSHADASAAQRVVAAMPSNLDVPYNGAGTMNSLSSYFGSGPLTIGAKSSLVIQGQLTGQAALDLAQVDASLLNALQSPYNRGLSIVANAMFDIGFTSDSFSAVFSETKNFGTGNGFISAAYTYDNVKGPQIQSLSKDLPTLTFTYTLLNDTTQAITGNLRFSMSASSDIRVMETPVPEMSTVAMHTLGLGLMGVVFTRRKKLAKAQVAA